MNTECFISVDVEAAGPIPGRYSLLSIGACVARDPTLTFYAELKPTSLEQLPEALAVTGFTLDMLARQGEDLEWALRRFKKWLHDVAGEARPVFVGFNAAFDWSFVNWSFQQVLGENPFHMAPVDIKSMLLGFQGEPWNATRSSQWPREFQPTRPGNHNALEDAQAQAEMFVKLLDHAQSCASGRRSGAMPAPPLSEDVGQLDCLDDIYRILEPAKPSSLLGLLKAFATGPNRFELRWKRLAPLLFLVLPVGALTLIAVGLSRNELLPFYVGTALLCLAVLGALAGMVSSFIGDLRYSRWKKAIEMRQDNARESKWLHALLWHDQAHLTHVHDQFSQEIIGVENRMAFLLGSVKTAGIPAALLALAVGYQGIISQMPTLKWTSGSVIGTVIGVYFSALAVESWLDGLRYQRDVLNRALKLKVSTKT